MTRRAFEQLVSEWLDRPAKADLRARVVRAIRRNRKLTGVLKEWIRLQKLVRSAVRAPTSVEWAELKTHIADRLERRANQAR